MSTVRLRWVDLLSRWVTSATTENYVRVAQGISSGRYLVNPQAVAVGSVLLTLLWCLQAAYPLAKLRFKGRDVLFIGVLSTLVFPEQLIVIPRYVMAVNVFQFQDTYQGLIPPFAASGLGIFLLRQVYYSIPNELIEAARIDGATEFGIWWRILLPLIRPGLATLAVGIVIATVPVIVVFMVFQRQFIQGLAGAVKG